MPDEKVAAPEETSAPEPVITEDSELLGDRVHGQTDMLSGDVVKLDDAALTALGLDAGEVGGTVIEDATTTATDDAEDDAEEPETTPAVDDSAIGKNFREAWEKDPASVIRELQATLSPEQQAELGIGTPTLNADPLDLVPDIPTLTGEGDFEWENAITDNLTAVKHALGGIRDSIGEKAEAAAVESIGKVAPYVDGAMASSDYAVFVLEKIAASLGYDIPPLDLDAVSKVAKNGGTWRQAIEKTHGKAIEKALTRAKQARAPRPETPPSESDTMGLAKITDDMSMPEMLRAMRGVLKTK